jgi:hypothetical protein
LDNQFETWLQGRSVPGVDLTKIKAPAMNFAENQSIAFAVVTPNTFTAKQKGEVIAAANKVQPADIQDSVGGKQCTMPSKSAITVFEYGKGACTASSAATPTKPK